MRVIASVLDYGLTDAGRPSKRYRQDEAEFPAAQIACEARTHEGSPAADRASFDALRSNENWVKIEDHYEISFIREATAAFAWRLPQKGRRSLAAAVRGSKSAGEKVALAKNHRAVHEWKNQTGSGIAQWRVAAAACA